MKELLSDHSTIIGRDSRIINPYGSNSFAPLSDKGRQIQTRLNKAYRKHYELLTNLLSESTPEIIKKLEGLNNQIKNAIEQNATYSKSIDEEFSKQQEWVDQQSNLLKVLLSEFDSQHIFVPDTNALIFNANIDSWQFGNICSFEVVLLPSVLSELDSLKVNHRNTEVRDKANICIRRIKEYRRRGSLNDGVNIVAGKVTLRSVALEPNMEKSLSWFAPDNNDDRFLAATIEIMRQHISSDITIVTNDINLQNKAEFSSIPFVEPPN